MGVLPLVVAVVQVGHGLQLILLSAQTDGGTTPAATASSSAALTGAGTADLWDDVVTLQPEQWVVVACTVGMFASVVQGYWMLQWTF
jgi:hypothetical protein